jgi:alpha-methylacyl-CoA racemase
MGPLQGFKIIEIAGIGPGQFCGMLLADMGARIIRIDRLSSTGLGIPLPAKYNLMNRSRPTIAIDLKHADGAELVLRLCAGADALFEGFRPGVMERLGIGPKECLGRNKRLVQNGPLANSVGHDGNYIGLAGPLSAIGAKDGQPVIPLNFVADFGGGGVYLAMGMLAAMLEAARSGEGQIVDAAMVDGAASLMTMFYGLHAGGMWREDRGSNLLDGGAPFYRTYATKDKKSVVVCAACFEAVFVTKTRDEWSKLLEGSDACFAPVLSMTEAPNHPHNKARKTFMELDGIVQPGPAPRFSRTRSEIKSPPAEPGAASNEALREWGLSKVEIEKLQKAGVIGKPANG